MFVIGSNKNDSVHLRGQMLEIRLFSVVLDTGMDGNDSEESVV